MTDDSELATLFRRTRPPAPDPAARARALGAARRAFARENADAAQGSPGEARHTIGRTGLIGRILGRFHMHTERLTLKPLLLGGTTLVAAAALAVVATHEMADRPLSGRTSRLLAESGTQTVSGNRQRNEVGDLALLAPGRQTGATPPAAALAEADRSDAGEPSLAELERSLDEKTRQLEAMSDKLSKQSSGVRRATRAPAEETLQQTAMTSGEPVAAPPPGIARADIAAPRGLIAPPDFDPLPPIYRDAGRDRFPDAEPNAFHAVAEAPVSTFSIDVDTASYSFVRRSLMEGRLPDPAAVRIEEMVNYFDYGYAPPADPETPFATDVEIMPTPWNPGTRLMRIGIKGYELTAAERPRANLVFLIDSSGSMNAPDRLPLLLASFRLLLDRLEPDDSVAIVTYAGQAGVVLEPTPAGDRARILTALDRLQAGGSTAGAAGIETAYRLAEQAFVDNGVNRVILATDGDFNVGMTDPAALKRLVERERRSGVMLSVLGFGEGNLNDALMQTLAQNGNGAAAYIDTLAEAQKTLVDEAGSTLFPIAKDVKIQIEFNPDTVGEYRLIGYETRMLARRDFNDDAVDAGEIGSGHAVTALYEFTPAGASREPDDLRYRQASAPEDAAGTTADDRRPAAHGDEYAFLKIRYKAPGGGASRLIGAPVTRADESAVPGTDTRFAAAVAGFGELLRGSPDLGAFGYDGVLALASAARGEDRFGYRSEFLQLVRLARAADAAAR